HTSRRGTAPRWGARSTAPRASAESGCPPPARRGSAPPHPPDPSHPPRRRAAGLRGGGPRARGMLSPPISTPYISGHKEINQPVLALAIRGLLRDQPLHGYELRKRLSESLGPMWGISYGSLYPALRRLEREGAIESAEPASPPTPIPATGSLDGDLAAARVRR